jgi:hypothetical protein
MRSQTQAPERDSRYARINVTSAFRSRWLVRGEGWTGGGQERTFHRPGTRSFSSLSSSPTLCAFAVIAAFLAVLASPPLRQRLADLADVPSEAWLSVSHRRAEVPASWGSVTVWARPDSGLYYCGGETLFGRRPGRYLSQGDALTLGYRPAAHRYCYGKEVQTQGVLSQLAKSPSGLWALLRRYLDWG